AETKVGEVAYLHGDAAVAGKEIQDRLSSELIIALIGPVASGVSTSAKILKRKLEATYSYDVPAIIKMSDFIAANADKIGGIAPKSDSLADRIVSFQDTGNKLREKLGNSFLAKRAIREISAVRHKDGYAQILADGGQPQDVPMPIRRVYIIDSI